MDYERVIKMLNDVEDMKGIGLHIHTFGRHEIDTMFFLGFLIKKRYEFSYKDEIIFIKRKLKGA
jgi:hypothetical protein